MADAPGEYELVIPQRGIWGTAGVNGWNIDPCDCSAVLFSLRCEGYQGRVPQRRDTAPAD